MADETERSELDELDLDEVGDGEVLPERTAMSVITPSDDDPLPLVEPLRGPEVL